MRPIDADKLFNSVFAILDDTEIDFWVVAKFMNLIHTTPTIDPPPNDPRMMEELREIVHQLEFCGYECEGGPLGMNIAFTRLKELAHRRKPEEVQT